MNKIMILAMLMVASVASATVVKLDSKKIQLGNLGAVTNSDVITQNGSFELERTSETPKIVKLYYTVKVPELQCTRYENRYIPCGGYYGGGYRRRRGGYRPYPGPGRPYPGMGYPRPGYGFPGPGLCMTSVCVETKEVLVNSNRKLKLNFRRATKMVDGETETFGLQFKAENRRLSYEVDAPHIYLVKKNKRRVKFKAL